MRCGLSKMDDKKVDTYRSSSTSCYQTCVSLGRELVGYIVDIFLFRDLMRAVYVHYKLKHQQV